MHVYWVYANSEKTAIQQTLSETILLLQSLCLSCGSWQARGADGGGHEHVRCGENDSEGSWDEEITRVQSSIDIIARPWKKVAKICQSVVDSSNTQSWYRGRAFEQIYAKKRRKYIRCFYPTPR